MTRNDKQIDLNKSFDKLELENATPDQIHQMFCTQAGSAKLIQPLIKHIKTLYDGLDLVDELCQKMVLDSENPEKTATNLALTLSRKARLVKDIIGSYKQVTEHFIMTGKLENSSTSDDHISSIYLEQLGHNTDRALEVTADIVAHSIQKNISKNKLTPFRQSIVAKNIEKNLSIPFEADDSDTNSDANNSFDSG